MPQQLTGLSSYSWTSGCRQSFLLMWRVKRLYAAAVLWILTIRASDWLYRCRRAESKRSVLLQRSLFRKTNSHTHARSCVSVSVCECWFATSQHSPVLVLDTSVSRVSREPTLNVLPLKPVFFGWKYCLFLLLSAHGESSGASSQRLNRPPSSWRNQSMKTRQLMFSHLTLLRVWTGFQIWAIQPEKLNMFDDSHQLDVLSHTVERCQSNVQSHRATLAPQSLWFQIIVRI